MEIYPYKFEVEEKNPIRGYKLLRPEGDSLYSPIFPEGEWRIGEWRVAACLFGEPIHEEIVPHVACDCGYSAYKYAIDAWHDRRWLLDKAADRPVFAIVEGAGRIIEHDEIWRAEKIKLIDACQVSSWKEVRRFVEKFLDSVNLKRSIERYASRVNGHRRACECQQCAEIRRNAARYARKRGVLTVGQERRSQ